MSLTMRETAARELPAYRRRSFLLFIAIACTLLLAAFLASGAFPIVLERLFREGSLALVWLAAAAGWGSLFLRQFSFRTRLCRTVIAIALGLGIVSILTLSLGRMGVLNRAMAWSMLGAGIALQIVRSKRWRENVHAFGDVLRQSIRPIDWLWLLATPAVAIALVASFAPPGILWGDEPNGYDVLEYHLQVPREWFEARRIVPLDHNVFSYFPMNIEMHYLLAMHLRGGPWAGMYLAQLMHACFIALAIVAMFAIARERAGGAAAVIATLAAVATPWLFLLAPVAYDEGGLLLFGAISAGLTWRALREEKSSKLRDWILAGACAGFACGCKLTAAPMLAAGIPIAMLLAQPSRWRENVKPAVVFFIAALVVFSPWLMRNISWSGNPVFPEAMSLLGHGSFDDTQRARWSQAHAPPPAERSVVARLVASGEQIVLDWRFGYALLPLAVAGAVVARRRAAARFLLFELLILAIIWIGFTHLQSRFFTPAIPIAVLLTVELIEAWPMLLRPASWVVALMTVGGLARWQVQYNTSRVETGGETSGIFARLRAAGAFGIDDLSVFTSPDLANLPADQTLALVGDARAFFYERPMDKLLYRTVFDVRASDSESIGERWLGKNVSKDTAVLIDPNELKRFSNPATGYFGIGKPGAEVASHEQEYLVMP